MCFTKNRSARFEVDTAVFIPVKTEVFCDMTPCRLVNNDISEGLAASVFRTSWSNKCLRLLSPEVSELLSPETSVAIYQLIWRTILYVYLNEFSDSI